MSRREPPTGGWLLAAEAAARARASRPVVLVPIPPPESVGKRGLVRCTYCNRRFKSAARYNLHWRVCHDPTNPMEEQG